MCVRINLQTENGRAVQMAADGRPQGRGAGRRERGQQQWSGRVEGQGEEEQLGGLFYRLVNV